MSTRPPLYPKMETKQPLVRTTVFLTENQKKALEKLSKLNDIPISNYIRHGVDIVLARASGKL